MHRTIHAAARRARRQTSARCAIPFSVVRTVPPSDWIATISTGLPCRLAASARVCATTCSQPSAMTSDGADVGMAAVGGEGVVGHAHVGPELPASRQVRHRGADRLNRGRDALGDDRRADDRRHDQHVVPRADAAVRPAIPQETRTVGHRFLSAVSLNAVPSRRAARRAAVAARAGVIRDLPARECSPGCACARANRQGSRRSPGRSGCRT